METGVFFEHDKSGFGGIYVLYNVGGRFEKTGFRGISHLAEHLKCKKEKQFKKEINTLNIETNAFTDDKVTAFYCKGGSEEIALFAKKFLSCALDNSIPDQKDFNTEKSIVLQEYISCLNDFTLSIAYSRAMYGYSGPIGYEEDIRNISYKSFSKFYNKHFSAPCCVVFIGDKKVEREYLRLRDGIKTISNNEKPISFKIRKNGSDMSDVKAWSKKSTKTATIFTDLSKTDFSVLSLKFFARLMSDGFYSPFWENIREKKSLLYTLNFCLSDYGGSRVLEFLTESDKWEEVKKEFFEILNNFEKYVSRDYYQDYVKKAMIFQKQVKLKKNTDFYILSRYGIPDEAFSLNFNPELEEFSYEKMLEISDQLKRQKWNSMVHYKDKIIFV